MKRALLACFTLLTLAVPLTAHAGKWITREIKWQISGLGPTGTSTAIWVRDTLYQAVDVDTTAMFSLDDATVPPHGLGGGNGIAGSATNVTGTGAAPYVQSDTTTVAWLIIQSDSSAATTATATSITAILDGKVGGFGPVATLGEGWVKADSIFVNGAAGGGMITGNDSYRVPIHTISPYGNVLAWPQLRARITVATGSIPAARVFLRYYRDE